MNEEQATMEWVDRRWIITMGNNRRESIRMNPTSGLWTCGGYNAHYDLSGMIRDILTNHGYDPELQGVYGWALDEESDEEN